MQVAFSINHYDFEGDMFDDCLLLHIGRNTDKMDTILRFDSIEEVKAFAESIIGMVPEMIEARAERT